MAILRQELSILHDRIPRRFQTGSSRYPWKWGWKGEMLHWDRFGELDLPKLWTHSPLHPFPSTGGGKSLESNRPKRKDLRMLTSGIQLAQEERSKGVDISDSHTQHTQQFRQLTLQECSHLLPHTSKAFYLLFGILSRKPSITSHLRKPSKRKDRDPSKQKKTWRKLPRYRKKKAWKKDHKDGTFWGQNKKFFKFYYANRDEKFNRRIGEKLRKALRK